MTILTGDAPCWQNTASGFLKQYNKGLRSLPFKVRQTAPSLRTQTTPNIKSGRSLKLRNKPKTSEDSQDYQPPFCFYQSACPGFYKIRQPGKTGIFNGTKITFEK
jgi:hypothetical protein